MSRARLSYSDAQISTAVAQVLDDASISVASKATGVHYRTLATWVAAAKRGEVRASKRRGPDPLLPPEAETNIYEWVIGRQQVLRPADRNEIINKASEISNMLYQRRLSDGWYKRFMQRFPQLSTRTAQSISKSRNSVTCDAVSLFHTTLATAYEKHKFEACQIFNMDETSFASRKNTKTVIAARGSRNVWTAEVSTNFHLTIIACGGAGGAVIPPAFILPGLSVKLNVLDLCTVPGAAVSTTESGFMNAELFAMWLRYFEASVPAKTPRPLLLIMDGCSAHYSLKVCGTAEELKIVLVSLQSNATHLFQPLDVAMFGSFKRKLRTLINSFVGKEGNESIPKDNALQLASLAWKGCRLDVNIQAGFRGCGLYPLSLTKMMSSLENFQRNGAPEELQQVAWLQYKPQVQTEILVLPRPPAKKKKRTTTTVAGCLLTRELLKQIDGELNAKKESTKTKRVATKGRKKTTKSKKVTSAQPSARGKTEGQPFIVGDILEQALV